jgi:hypothetical protein
MPVATRAAWGGNRCLSAFSWSSTVPTRTGWLGSGPPRWATSSRRPRLDSLPGTTSTASWGVPEEELVDGADRISDPEGHGPSIWFHAVPDAKVVKNRLHLDIHASGERTDPIEARRKRVDAEASRLAGLGAIITGALSEEGLDHYAVGMKDPEGNEFDIN